MRLRTEMNQGLILLACLALCALGASRCAAQELSERAGDEALKFDEFGQVGGCEYGARMDNLVVQLQNEPTADCYLVCYGPEGEGSGTGNYALIVAKGYMVSMRGLDEKRIKTIYAGHYKELNEVLMELWIAPHGAPPPEPIRYNTRPETFTGKFEEFEAWDDISSYEDEGTGPTHGNVHRASFAAIVHRQTDTRVWVVAYNMKGAVPGAWRRSTKQLVSDLQDGYKIEAERIGIIYAGYRERREKKEEVDGVREASAFVQLWILPKDAPPPAAEVKEAEARPAEATQLSAHNAYQMTDEQEARRAFEDFADVLRSDEKLNACLILRLPNKTEKEVDGDDEAQKTGGAPVTTTKPVDVPKADLVALAEKWRADLVKDYGISEHRLVVTRGEADEWSDGAIETWIVPSGAALPDPNKKAETEVVDETSEGYEVMAFEEGTPKEF